jgi:hypothetical protein
MAGRPARLFSAAARLTVLALLFIPALHPRGHSPAYGQEVQADQTAQPDQSASSEEGIFDAGSFDQAVEQSVAGEKKTKLETRLGGDVLFSSDFAFPLDFGSYYMSSFISGKLFGKLSYPDIVTLYVSYNFLHDILRFGTPGSGQTGGQTGVTSLFDVEAELSELFIDFDVRKKVFFRAGNQLIAWGPSVFWTPVDFINLNRLDPLARLDLRTGKPGLRVHVPLKKSNLFTFFDFSESVDRNGSSRDLYESLRVGLRYDRILLGYEIGLGTYFGQGVRTVVGFDFSGVLLRSDFYGEAAVSKGSNTPRAELVTPPDYTLAATGDFVYAVSLGLQKSLGEFKYWKAGGELFYNSDGYGEDPPIEFLLAQGLYNPLYTGKLCGSLSLSKSNFFNNTNITGSLTYIMNVSDLSFTAYGTFGFVFPRLVPFNVRLTYAGGKTGRTFTPGGKDSLTTSVYTKVSF